MKVFDDQVISKLRQTKSREDLADAFELMMKSHQAGETEQQNMPEYLGCAGAVTEVRGCRLVTHILKCDEPGDSPPNWDYIGMLLHRAFWHTLGEGRSSMTGSKRMGGDSVAFRDEMERFFEKAWGELDKPQSRDEISELIFTFEWFFRDNHNYDPKVFERYMDNLLHILRHPEEDKDNLRVPASDSPTWEWWGRLLLGAMEMSVHESDSASA